MKANYKYFAFISYSHKDSEFAKWLQHEFEYYELPSTLNGREDLPKSFRPIFRDEDELAGGELKPQISEALANSEYLIVICSPNSAKSIYVDNEIREFIGLSNENKRKVFPFIIEGKPHQENMVIECFPKILIELSNDREDPVELIAGDVNATGKNHAFVKILAGTLKEKDIRFSDLWDRYELNRVEKERKERENRIKLQVSQSRFVAEKANKLSVDGDTYTAQRLCLEVLPNDAKDESKPYVFDCELALRNSRNKMQTCVNSPIASLNMEFSVNRMFFSHKSNVLYLFSVFNVKEINCVNGKYIEYNLMDYNSRNSYCQNVPEYIIINTGRGQKGHFYLYNIINKEKVILGFRKDGLVNAFFCSNGRIICLQHRDFTKLLEFKNINTDYTSKDFPFAYNETIAILPEVELAVLYKYEEQTIYFFSLKSSVVIHTIKIKNIITRHISTEDVIANTEEFYLCVKINLRVIIISFENFNFKIIKSCVLSPDFNRNLSKSVFFIKDKGFLLFDSKQILLFDINAKTRECIFKHDEYILSCAKKNDFIYFATYNGIIFRLNLIDQSIKKITIPLGNVIDLSLSFNHKYISVLTEYQGKQNIKLLSTQNSIKADGLFNDVKATYISGKKIEVYVGHKLVKKFSGHRDYIKKLDFDTNFHTFFSLAANSERILIWNDQSLKHSRTPAFNCYISDFTYCQIRKTLCIILRDGNYYEYDVIRDEIVFENRLPQQGYRLCVTSNKINSQIAIGDYNILYIKNNNIVTKKTIIDEEIYYIQYNHNATQIYVGCINGITYIYDIESDTMQPLEGKSSLIYNIISNPSDNFIGIESADPFKFIVVDLVTCKPIVDIHAVTSNVVFDSNNRFVAACILNKGVCIWDLHLHTMYTLDEKEEFKFLNFSPDGKFLRGITKEGISMYWETLTFSELVKESAKIFSAHPLTEIERREFNLEL